MGKRKTRPDNMVATMLDTTRMMMEAQAVMGMRFMGMAGMWNVSPQEVSDMMSEKQLAFSQSAVAMGKATMAGSSAETIFNAGSQPLRTKTSANYRRLTKNGAKMPKG